MQDIPLSLINLRYLISLIHSQTLVFICDSQGETVYANEKFCEISYYTENDLIRTYDPLLSSSITNTNFLKQIKAALMDSKIWSGNIECLRKDGSLYWIQSLIIPCINDNKLTHFLVLGHELNTNEKSLKETILEQKIAYVAQMTATLSYEVNNPLTVISGYLSRILDHSRVDDELDKDIIENSALKIQNIVERISKVVEMFDLIGGEDFDCSFNDCDLNEVLDQVVSFLRVQLRANGIQIIWKSLEIPCIVCAREKHLKQVVFNLLKNSMESIQSLNEKWICIDLEMPDFDHYEVKVIDSGETLSKEKRERIFNPFISYNSSFNSLGLGLTITKKVINDHGGDIEYCSLAEHGCFKFKLPRFET